MKPNGLIKWRMLNRKEWINSVKDAGYSRMIGLDVVC